MRSLLPAALRRSLTGFVLAPVLIFDGHLTRSGTSAPALITTERLAQVIAESPRELTVIDVRESWTDYLQNHLPGAGWLHVETLRVSQDGLPFQLLPAEDYATIFTRLGVQVGRPVVIYSAGSALDIDATFVAWLLTALGQQPVYILDGGYAKWELENRPLTQKYPDTKRSNFPRGPFTPEVASLEDIRQAVARKDVLLIDARPPEQFAGQAGAQMRRGHIPGAINHPWKGDLEVRDLATVWKPVETLRAEYLTQGISSERDIIAYCNTGTEASHIFFALRYLLGYPRVRIYVGSWSQWAEQEDLPIEK